MGWLVETDKLEVTFALKGDTYFGNDETLYMLDEFSGHEMTSDLGVLRVVEEDIWVTWCLLKEQGSCSDGKIYELYAWGDGPSGNLREPRHTYFGRDGYIFYVDPEILEWGFKHLREWFDYCYG